MNGKGLARFFLALSLLPSTLFGKVDEDKIKIEKQKTPTPPASSRKTSDSNIAAANREDEGKDLYGKDY